MKQMIQNQTEKKVAMQGISASHSKESGVTYNVCNQDFKETLMMLRNNCN